QQIRNLQSSIRNETSGRVSGLRTAAPANRHATNEARVLETPVRSGRPVSSVAPSGPDIVRAESERIRQKPAYRLGRAGRSPGRGPDGPQVSKWYAVPTSRAIAKKTDASREHLARS